MILNEELSSPMSRMLRHRVHRCGQPRRGIAATKSPRVGLLRSGQASEAESAAPVVSQRWILLAILTASYGAGAFGILGLSPLSPSLLARSGSPS
jgi:hypothetical protein